MSSSASTLEGGDSPSTSSIVKVPKSKKNKNIHFNGIINKTKVNRYIILTMYSIIMVIIGPIFMNWPPIRDILVQQGAYQWECIPTDLLDDNRTCVNQRNKIAFLNTMANSSMYIFCAVGGVLLDQFGAKVVCLFGLACEFLGFILLAFSTKSFNAYIAAFAFIGAGTDPTFYGLIDVGFLFPGYTSTAISVLGTCRSLSFVLPIAFRAMQDAGMGFPGIFGLWALITVLVALACFWLVPSKSYLDTEEVLDEVRSIRQPKSSMESIELKKAKRAQWRDLGHIVISNKFWPFVPYFCIVVIRNAFYGASASDQLPDATDFFSIMAPLSFIPCPVIGLGVDKFGSVPILIFLNTVGVFLFVFVLPDSPATQYISVVFFWISVSFVSSQIYTFMTSSFPQRHIGRLIGFTMLVGGLVGFVAGPMYASANESGDFDPMNWVVIGLSLLGFVALAWLLVVHTLRPRRDEKLKIILAVSRHDDLASLDKKESADP